MINQYGLKSWQGRFRLGIMKNWKNGQALEWAAQGRGGITVARGAQ